MGRRTPTFKGEAVCAAASWTPSKDATQAAARVAPRRLGRAFARMRGCKADPPDAIFLDGKHWRLIA
jgi:hypothetical protein